MFRIKDLGPLKYFLGIEVARPPKGLSLCQRKYTLNILTECGMLDAKPVDFLMEQNHRLRVVDGAKVTDAAMYR